jgi:Nucleotidyl transferase AbiEii toxin, Type IV TA system
MTPLESVLRSAAAALADAGASFALIGGLAVSVRSEPRFTRDADLAVAVTDDTEAESIVRQCQATGFGVHALLEHTGTHRLATVRLTPTTGHHGAVIDLLFASSGVEPEIVAAAHRIVVLPALMLPVARTGHLIALKLLARDDIERPQDIADLRALLRHASPEDVTLARTAISLITLRGYNRGRDLDAALDHLLGAQK